MANSARPIRCSGYSIRVRWQSGLRKKSSSAAATPGFSSLPITPLDIRLSSKRLRSCANGGKVLGAVRHPFATPDLSSFILQAQTSKAKIIGIASGPPDNTNAIKLAGEFGVFQGGQQLAGLLVGITGNQGVGLEAGSGL